MFSYEMGTDQILFSFLKLMNVSYRFTQDIDIIDVDVSRLLGKCEGKKNEVLLKNCIIMLSPSTKART
jgi:hypothetical protein